MTPEDTLTVLPGAQVCIALIIATAHEERCKRDEGTCADCCENARKLHMNLLRETRTSTETIDFAFQVSIALVLVKSRFLLIRSSPAGTSCTRTSAYAVSIYTWAACASSMHCNQQNDSTHSELCVLLRSVCPNEEQNAWWENETRAGSIKCE